MTRHQRCAAHSGGSLDDAVLARLAREDLAGPQLAERLGVPLTSMQGCMKRLAARGAVECVSEGWADGKVWRLRR